MPKYVEYVAIIESLTRKTNSVNGNPKFQIHFYGGATATTQTDTSIAYGLENRENVGVPVRVKATLTGYVWDVAPLSDEERKEWEAKGKPGPTLGRSVPEWGQVKSD